MFLSLRQFEKNIYLPILNLTAQKTSLNFKSNVIKIFGLDLKRFFVSIIWINTFIIADTNHTKVSTGFLNDWLYLRFNFITDIIPNLYEAYLYGGQYLSVVKNNPIAAEKLLNKSSNYFKEDYQLNYTRGMNALFDLKDKKLALVSFERMKKSNEFEKYPILKSIYLKLLEKTGDYEKLKSYFVPTKNKKINMILYNLKTKIDLDCLNNIKYNCDTRDLFGKPYRKRGAKYFAPRNLIIKNQ